MTSHEISREIIKRISEKGIEEGPVLHPLFEKIEKLEVLEKSLENNDNFAKCEECGVWVDLDQLITCFLCPISIKCEKHRRRIRIGANCHYLCDEHYSPSSPLIFEKI